MGVDTKAVVPETVDAGRIADILRQDYGATEVRITPTNEPDFVRITYNHSEEPHGRMMSVFFGDMVDRDYGKDIGVNLTGGATLLSLNASGDAEGAMMAVLNRFGGFLLRNDCADIGWEGISMSDHIGPDLSDAPRFEVALNQAVEKTMASFQNVGFPLPEDTQAVLRQAIEASMRELIPAQEPAALVSGPKP